MEEENKKKDKPARINKGDLVALFILSSINKFWYFPRAPKKRFDWDIQYRKAPSSFEMLPRKAILSCNKAHLGMVVDKYRCSRSHHDKWVPPGGAYKIHGVQPGEHQKLPQYTEVFVIYHILINEEIILFDSRLLKFTSWDGTNMTLTFLQEED